MSVRRDKQTDRKDKTNSQKSVWTKNKMTERQPDATDFLELDKCSNKQINWQTQSQTEGVLDFSIDVPDFDTPLPVSEPTQ